MSDFLCWVVGLLLLTHAFFSPLVLQQSNGWCCMYSNQGLKERVQIIQWRDAASRHNNSLVLPRVPRAVLQSTRCTALLNLLHAYSEAEEKETNNTPLLTSGGMSPAINSSLVFW
jgi:hypothetical protein